MGLEKDFDYLGKIANYWKVTRSTEDYISRTTMVELRLFWDKSSRDSNINNFLPHREILHLDSVDLSRSQLYNKIKESKIDEKGIERNYFVDAKNVLENGQMEEDNDLKK